jgi:hypothetical protein
MRLDLAYTWYRKLLKEYQEKKQIYFLRGFKTPVIQSRDWEVFGSLLLNDKANKGLGSDLQNHEIKSAQVGNSFEYQYARISGMKKWHHESSIDHLLISYEKDYMDITARLLPAHMANAIMKEWFLKIEEAYYQGKPRQRCRLAIPYDYVVDYGAVVFRTCDSKLFIETNICCLEK